MNKFIEWIDRVEISEYNLQIKIQSCNEKSILILNRPRTNKSQIYDLLKSSKCSFVLTNDVSLSGEKNVFYVADEQFQDARVTLINKFFNVDKKIKYIAVTGTNGKTSTTHFLREMLFQLGFSVGSVGTLGYYVGNQLLFENAQTTPDLYDLKKFIFDHQTRIDYFVMEVSSHALDQDRLFGLMFDCAIWTNFTQDHLDYHKTMQEYFNAKAKILNVLGDNSKLLVLKNHKDIWSKLNSEKVEIVNDTKLSLPEEFNTCFNQENISLSLECLKILNINSIKIDLSKIPVVPGRFNLEYVEGKVVIIDFAHTPDALENVLQQVRRDFKGKKIATVFGCGGDRDRTKRPIMGEIASKYSDKIIITSDNPRGENPDQVIDDIALGIKNDIQYHKIENRVTAIKYALGAEINADVILIAGKGHETSMNYAGKLISHNDHDVVSKIREKKI
jgi:UDP-N-acetylmuramoyl-L-alanyl-D-glutamate--2,6-diaminopimelate ligase